MNLYGDRREAGKQLSKHLRNKTDIDTVIVPYPESVKIGEEIAKSENLNVSIKLSGYISAPDVPYANIGAVVEDGTIWIDDGLKSELKVPTSHIENKARIKSNFLKEKSFDLKKAKDDFKGENVAIVSEGINSGFREAAVAGSLMKGGAENIYVLAPFKSKNVMADIDAVVDKMYYLHEIPFLSSPESCYESESENIPHRYENSIA